MTITKKYCIQIDPKVPGSRFLLQFRSTSAKIYRIREALQRIRRSLFIELLSMDRPHRLDEALCAIRNMNDRRFLTAYELLAFDSAHPQLQMQCQIIIPTITIGIDHGDIPSCAKREHYGKTLEDAEDIAGKLIPSNALYATAPHRNLVDKGELEPWLSSNLASLVSPKLLLGGRD